MQVRFCHFSGGGTLTETGCIISGDTSEPDGMGLTLSETTYEPPNIGIIVIRSMIGTESICIESAIQPQSIYNLWAIRLEEGCLLLDTEKKEELSHAYIHAIATKAGYSCFHHPKPDNDSIDVQIRGNTHPVEDSICNPMMDIQLKATATHSFDDGHLHFPLKKKNYDDLRAESLVPRLLVVLILPKEESEWVVHSEEEMVSKKCAYYRSLRGELDSKNQSTITIKIPKSNILSPEELGRLMIKASKREAI